MEFFEELMPTIISAHIGREGAFPMLYVTNALNNLEFDVTLIGPTVSYY
jgi:hypothetical protein